MIENDEPTAGSYLWDRSGPPDPEVAALERLLGGVADRCPVPRLGRLPATAPPRRWPLWQGAAAAVAAALVLVVGGTALRVWLTPWQVTTLVGRVLVEQQPAASPMSIRGGQVIETDGRSRALLSVGVIGHVEIDPGSRLRIVTTNRREHRLALDRGRISAVIDAPPRWFTVDTPAAAAIDFGCAYTLEVAASGDGTLRVQEGWVQLDGASHEAMVPEGAMAYIRPGRGPGSPFYQDASDAFSRALALVDFGGDGEVAASLPVVLAAARPRDSLTLLSLLRRLDSAGRGDVYDRLSALLPPPGPVTRERILGGDLDAIDRWWEALALPRPRKLLPRLWGFGT